MPNARVSGGAVDLLARIDVILRAAEELAAWQEEQRTRCAAMWEAQRLALGAIERSADTLRGWILRIDSHHSAANKDPKS